MDFLILGPIEVRNGSGPVALGGIKPRAVLAVLLLHPNEPVSADRLALALWGEDAPGGAVKTVQVHVSRLRKALGDPDAVTTTAAGYSLRVRRGELDAERFEELVEEGRRALAARQPEDAATILREALALWRGPPLAELADEPFAGAEIARLQEQRLAALELRVEADLAAGRHAEVVGELGQLVRDNPARERLAGQLMLALYRCGRQSEALEAYATTRRTLVEELGIEPGPQLRDLHEAILRQDVALDPQPSDTELPSALDPANASPLVGRDAELAWLLARWESASGGDGMVVALAGPRGSGKSRLTAELARAAHRSGVTILHASGDGPADTILVALRRVREATRPVLLVIDDADRAGAGVHDELEKLGALLAGVPALVVACADRPPQYAEATLELASLDADAVRTIAARYAPGRGAGEVPAEWLHEASAGVPSRVHELASQWARREAVRHVGAVADRAQAQRAELGTIEDELADGLVDLQETRQRIVPGGGRGGGDARIVCPFKGLASFDVADAPYFFGRERLVAELVARLVGAPLLGVVGPSGSGKSSVLRAGLLPALASGVLPGSERWSQAIMRPGRHPLRELGAALAQTDGAERVVLAVDQFEETFTTCDDEAERDDFVAELVHAALDSSGRYVVVLALRADHYGRCAAYPELAALLAKSNVLVGAMSRDELRRAVEGPSLRADLRLEPELVDALVDDVEREPGGLPLLSTALLELWQRRDGRRLRHSAYVQSGGVHGAVARLAEDAFAQLDAAQQALARGVLMRLVGAADGDTVERRRVALEDLEIDGNEDLARVVALLTDRRLLTVSAGTVELAHEALLREWPRLRGWIEDDLDGLRIQRSLSATAEEWERLGRDEGALLRGSRLTEAIEWRDARQPRLNEVERAFLAAGEAARERERVTRRRRTALAVGSAATVVLAIVVVTIITVLTNRERDTVASRDIAAKSGALVGSDPGLALALARSALDRRDTEQARLALRQATFANRMVAVLRADAAGASGVAVSEPDGLIATAGDDGDVKLWNAESRRVVATVKGRDAPAKAVSFSDDGDRVAIAYSDGTVAVAGVDGRVVRTAKLPPDVVARAVDFSPTGSAVAVGTNTGAVRLIGARSGSDADRTLGQNGTTVNAVSFDKSGSRLASVSEDDSARVWNTATGASAALGPAEKGIGVSFSRDGRVATAGADGHVRIWDPASGERLRDAPVADVELLSAEFSADGRQLVAGAADGGVKLLDVASGVLLSDMRGHAGFVNDVAFVPGGRTIASVGADGTLRMWDPPEALVSAHPGIAVGFGSDDRQVATGGYFPEPDAWLWDLEAGTGRTIATDEGATVTSFSSDGDQIAIARGSGRVALYDVATRKLRDVPESDAQYVAVVDRTGERVAFGGEDKDVVVQRPDGTQRRKLRGHTRDIFALAFSPDGKHLVSGSRDTTVRIWNAATGKAERVIRGHGQPVTWVAYSDDGSRVASASDDGTVRIAPVDGGLPLVLVGHEGRVSTVDFGPRGDWVVTAGDDGTVRVWDARSGDQLVVLRTYDGPAWGADFSSDGTRVVSAGDGYMIVTPCDVCGSMRDVLRAAEDRPTRRLSAAERERLLEDGG